MNIFFTSLLINLLISSFVWAGSTPPTKVTLQLNWKQQFEFAGYFIAQEKGFYQDVGLDVDILEYQNEINLANSVIKNNHTFAIGYTSTILDETNTNKLVLLAALFQSSPHILVSLKSSAITSIKDFKNKKIMISKEETKSAEFVAMLQANGISFNDMIISNPSFKVEHLIDGSVDIGSYFSTNETYFLDKLGVAYNIWNPKEYGFDFYSDILFTSKKELKEYPQIVENFRSASLKGWQYAFEHIDETVELMMQRFNSQHKTRAALLYEARKLKSLAYDKNTPLGTLKKEKIQRVIDLYTLLGLYKNNININTLLYTEPRTFHLTQKEQAYLENKKVITMCTDPDWMPFEKIDNGKHIGMAADYFDVIRSTTGLDIQLIPTKSWTQSLEFAKQRKCDILSLLMSTPERSKYLEFTKPYLHIPIVMATKTDVPFTHDFNLLKGKKLGIPKGYAFTEILRINYPDLDIVEVESIDDGLKKVVEGKLYGYIGTLASIGYSFQKKFTGELKISGKFDGTWDLGIGVRNDDPILLGIFKKVVDSIDEETQQKILNNWLAINYTKVTDYNLLFKTIGFFIIILLIVLFFYVKQLKLKKELQLLASTDPLTKLYNRRYFTDTAEQYLQLAKRHPTYLALIMLDIDNFKSVNDTKGHKVGDLVLIELAHILQSLSRKSDIICRFGGEEFIILLPQTSLEGANIMAEKIRVNVANNRLYLDDNTQLTFTISLGVSTIDLSNDQNIEASIKRADDALYEAKGSGKNKVCIKTS